MVIEINPQNIPIILGVLGAIGACIGCLLKGYDWYKSQTVQATAQEKQLTEIRETHATDIHSVREEQALIIYGVLACLKGLREQGCNGPVTKAIEKIEKHLNEEAHK